MADRVILWTRAVPLADSGAAPAVDWFIARDPGFADIVAKGTATAQPERDYCVKVDAAGLAADSRYYYRFESGAARSPVGRTRTLPSGAVDEISLAVMSCSNLPWGYFNAYRALARRDDIAAMVHLGDYIYEYERGRYASATIEALGRQVSPPGETISLADYRTRYATYRRDADLQAAHAAHPMIAVWDDHESTNDGWMDGAENHNEGEGDWADRKAASRQAWLEWLPVRETGDTAAGRIYRQFDLGDLASLIMLDTRLIGRDRQWDYRQDLALDPKAGPQAMAAAVARFRAEKLDRADRSLLGEPQEAWLAQALAASKARGQIWQVIGQQVVVGTMRSPEALAAMVDPAKPGLASIDALRYFGLLSRLGLPFNLDAWDGYPAARARMLDAGLDHANNLLTLSGDTHNAWAFRLPRKGRLAGVDLATHSISSPGMEYYLNAPPAALAKALVDTNPDLLWANTHNRGYLTVTLRRDQALARWWALSSVTDKNFNESLLQSLMVTPAQGPGLGSVALG
ncbi:MAG: alkaline phosphatase D family protein [Sphingomonadales bacterium]